MSRTRMSVANDDVDIFQVYLIDFATRNNRKAFGHVCRVLKNTDKLIIT